MGVKKDKQNKKYNFKIDKAIILKIIKPQAIDKNKNE